MRVKAYIGLGSNLGTREDFLQRALDALRRQPSLEITRVSSILETDPVGGPPDQGRYLNAVAEVETTLSPDELLRLLLDVERSLGRERGERFGPRTIDLDILLYANVVREGRDLTLPHPRMHEREFVLRPLVEIAPNVVHPELGRTAAELLQEVRRPTSPKSAAVAGPQPSRELTGKRVLVTGSTGGIGRAVALELARAGADVLIHGRRSPETAGRVVREAVGHDVRSLALMADLRDPGERDRLAREAWDAWGGLDVLVNNAGADTLTGEAARWPFDRKLQELWAVDVLATIHLSRELGERMRQAGGGVILNVGWDQAETGMAGDSGQLFGATKAAVMSFSKSLALTLAPQVRVNCLAPGWIRTAWGEGASKEWQEQVLRETPLARWGKPEDVAAVARWLASPAASFLTGQVVRVNGGTVR